MNILFMTLLILFAFGCLNIGATLGFMICAILTSNKGREINNEFY